MGAAKVGGGEPLGRGGTADQVAAVQECSVPQCTGAAKKGGGGRARGEGRGGAAEWQVCGAARGDPESGGRRRRGQRSGAASASPSGARGANACRAVAERISAGGNIEKMSCRPALKTCCLSSGLVARLLPLSRVRDRIEYGKDPPARHSSVTLVVWTLLAPATLKEETFRDGTPPVESWRPGTAAADRPWTRGSRPVPKVVCSGPAFRLA